MNSRYYLLLILSILTSIGYAQNIITVNTPETSNTTHAACMEVHFLPGYHYGAVPGQNLHAYIDKYQVCDVPYVSGSSSGGEGTVPALNTDYPVGTTEGTFAVSPYGSASYTVNLIVPPGTEGMVPHLSVNYNSNGGDGWLGKNWGLAGLSSISRTSKTIYHDGGVSPVTLDNTTPFELDGNRLLFNGTGTYGASGVTYATEVETFQRITSFGTAGAGPAYFTVETKDGVIMEYGNTADSRVEASGGSTTVLTWLLNKVTDNKGNYYTITYLENNATGEFRPDHIDYTGNATAGLTPYNQIKFVYGARADKQIQYIAGHQLQQNVLLTSLEVYAQGIKMHEYDFNYSYDVGSHLSELVEKGSDDKQYNSTKFSWENTYTVKPQENAISYFDDKAGDYLSADINGDGFSDVVQLNLNDWNIYQNNYVTTGSVSFSTPASNGSGILDANISSAQQQAGRILRHYGGNYDLNGDGYDDMLVFLPETGGNLNFDILTYSGLPTSSSFKYFLSNGTGLVEGASLLQPQTTINTDGDRYSNCGYTLGDFDGDGTTDLFVYYSFGEKWYIYSFKTGAPALIGSGSNSLGGALANEGRWESSQYNYTSNAGISQLCDFYAADINGDGKDELLVVGDGIFGPNSTAPGGLTFFINNFTTAGTLQELSTDYYPSKKNTGGSFLADINAVRPGDFNGDGRMDLLVYTDGTGWKINYSNGISFLASATTVPLSNYIPYSISIVSHYPDGLDRKHEFFVNDLNADGTTDIFEKITDGSTGTDLHTLYSVGTSFIEDHTHLSNIYSPTSVLAAVTNTIGDYNGDGHSDVLYHDGSTTRSTAYFTFLPEKELHKIHQIINGLNFMTRVDYKTLPQLAATNHYTKDHSGVYPLMDIQRAVQVVSQVSQDNGIGGLNQQAYSYSGAKIHLTGKGFVGFLASTTVDNETNIKEENTFDNPSAGNFFQPNLIETKTTLVNSTGTFVAAIGDRNFQYQINALAGVRYHSYVKQIIDNDQLHGNINTSVIHEDAYGNIDQQSNSNSAVITTTVNTYEQKGAWIPSRLTSTTSSTIRSGSTNPPYVRTAGYTNNLLGQRVSINSDGGNTITSVTYDAFGNQITTSVAGADIITRNNINAYDALGRFIISRTNSVGQTEHYSYDNAYGNPQTYENINGLLTRFTYDGFGSLKQTTTAANQNIAYSVNWDNGSVANGIFSITTSETGMPSTVVYKDVIGRELRSQSVGFDGTPINTDNIYNSKGLIIKTSESYYDGATALFNTYSYDNFLRPLEIDNANGSTITYSYSGNTTTTVTSTGSGISTTSQTTDASGSVVSITDNGGTLAYTYDNSGNPVTTSIPGSIQPLVMTYDQLGRKTGINDPDGGTYSYSYDALGELVSKIDPNAHTHIISYDALGRISSYAGSSTEGTVTYTYDTKPHGKGFLASVTTSGNFIGSQEYGYDSYGRLQSLSNNNIDGVNYTKIYQYDNLNRLVSETYPGAVPFTINRTYNSYGYLESIRKASDNSLIWKCNGMSEFQQVTSSQSGNGQTTIKSYSDLGYLQSIQVSTSSYVPVWKQGYNFDPTNGNLSSRSDNLPSYDFHKEEFSYDNLDRLTEVKLNSTTTLAMDYASSGNIMNKSDVGDYDYSAPMPHAVTGITNPATTFPYLLQSVSYNEFKRATTISEGLNKVDIFYGADHSRLKMVITNGVTATATKYYVNDYEKTVAATGNVRELNYIYATDGLCAIFAHNVTSSIPLDTMYYINTDHLGSISLISDQSGNVVQEVSYDAWGRRRNAATWNYATTPTHYLFDRGFSGQEHLEQMSLINFNSRIYDPVVGRMLSADDLVQSQDLTQSYNRYSYTFNNPLKYIDPSGYKSTTWEGREETDNPSPFFVRLMESIFGAGSASHYLGGFHFSDITSGFSSGGASAVEAREYETNGGGLVDALNNNVSHDFTYYYVFERWTPNIYRNTSIDLKEQPKWKVLTFNGSNSPLTTYNRNFLSNKLPVSPNPSWSRDEFPMACTREGGALAKVRYVPSIENSIQGCVLRVALAGKSAGTLIYVVLVPKGMENSPIFVPLLAPFPKLKEREAPQLIPIPTAEGLSILKIVEEVTISLLEFGL